MRVFLFAASLLCNKALLHGHKRVQQGGASQSLQSGRPHYSSSTALPSSVVCTCTRFFRLTASASSYITDSTVMTGMVVASRGSSPLPSARTPYFLIRWKNSLSMVERLSRGCRCIASGSRAS